MPRIYTLALIALAALTLTLGGALADSNSCISEGGSKNGSQESLDCAGECDDDEAGNSVKCETSGVIQSPSGDYRDCACGGTNGTPTANCCRVVLLVSGGFKKRGSCTNCGTTGRCLLFTTTDGNDSNTEATCI